MRRRRVVRSKGKGGGIFSVQFILIATVALWIGVVLFGFWRLVVSKSTTTTTTATEDVKPTLIVTKEVIPVIHDENIILLHLQMTPPIVVRLKLFADESPDSARFIRELINDKEHQTSNLYRAEPVPDYWGSPDYPDRWFDGGRWGPPYALLQGELTATSSANIQIAKAEDYRPIIQRGMVAWAGGQGGPHFFIALADHPEWQHDHSVWATVPHDEDMALLDELLVTQPLKAITPKRPPNLSYFVTPIDLTVTASSS